ncbi:MAG: type II toxin-antitoxin system VapC family toxin [Terracidiphilus sp.]|jgi:tRNA(fMet)-specific endonuclease VapC
MPPIYLLDTNIVSYFVRGSSIAVREHLVRIPVAKMAISAVTEAELLFWIARRPGDERTRVSVRDFLMRVPSLAWDSRAAEVYAIQREQQQRKGRPLSTEDLMIAAHALSAGLTLVTHDEAFSYVDGLKTEDWTVA